MKNTILTLAATWLLATIGLGQPCLDAGPAVTVSLRADSSGAPLLKWFDFEDHFDLGLVPRFLRIQGAVKDIRLRYATLGAIPQDSINALVHLYDEMMDNAAVDSTIYDPSISAMWSRSGLGLGEAISSVNPLKGMTIAQYRMGADSISTRLFNPNPYLNDGDLASVLLLFSGKVKEGRIDPLRQDFNHPLTAANFWLWFSDSKAGTPVAELNAEWVKKFISTVLQHVPEAAEIEFQGRFIYQSGNLVGEFSSLPNECTPLPWGGGEDPRPAYLLLAYLNR